MHTHEFEFENGVECSSRISGFKGIITSCSHHLNGCDRYFVNPKVDKDGKMLEGYWFDDGEIIIKKDTEKLPQTNTDTGGFPSKVK